MAETLDIPLNRVAQLRNRNCPYCGLTLGDTGWDKEHVIGRRFVPRGTLHGAWNLLLRSCRPCNAAKAELEDDISAITMHPDSAGRFALDDDRLRAEGRRKCDGSKSRKTGRSVNESQSKITIKGRLGPMTITFDMTAPPQIEPERLYTLAHRQLAGLFFFITYDEKTERGGFFPGEFWPVIVAPRGDWGNLRLRWFAETTARWRTRIHVVTADGFYKAWIRRRDEGSRIWAWAVEWNGNYRVAGFFGDKELMDEIGSHMTTEPMQEMPTIDGGHFAVRLDRPITENDDNLFDVPPEDLTK